MNLKNGGIYKITCISNGKIYIGSSICVRNRINQHLSKLRRGEHDNSYLQNAFNKYGEKNFLFEMIEEVLDKNNIIIREQYWIDKLNVCDRNIGFNIVQKAGSQLGYRHTKEAREKMSKARLGHKVSNESKDKARLSNPGLRIVVCLETGQEFEGINYTATKLNLNRNTVKDNCNHVQNSAGGFHFLFKEDYLSLKYSQILDIINGRFNFLQIQQMEKDGIVFDDNIVSKQVLVYKVYHNDGEKHNCMYICRNLLDLNIFFRRLDDWFGFYVKKEMINIDYHEQVFNIQKPRKKKYAKRKIICKQDGKIFESASEAGRYYNIHNSGIGAVCSGKIKQIHGYTFEYYKD